MIMTKTLVIQSDPITISTLCDRLKAGLFDGFLRKVEAGEERSNRRPSFRFRWPGDADLPSALVRLDPYGDSALRVESVFPLERGPFSDEQYNGVLDEFERRVIRPSALGLTVAITWITPLDKLEASLPMETSGLLQEFSELADRATLQPVDLRRWERFIIRVVLDEAVLDEDDLGFWLKSQGWSDPLIADLLGRYIAGLSLLNGYDRARAFA